MRRILPCLIFLLFSANTVHASPVFELVGGFGGQGALQARHAGPSAASAYFNPALLTDAPAGVRFGVLVLNSEIGVHVSARSASAAVPDGLTTAFHEDGSRFTTYPIATDYLQNGKPADPVKMSPELNARPRQHAGTGHQTVTYEAMGLVVKLFDEKLALGFYGLIPNVNFTTFNTFYVDEREQYSSNSLHPELYGDRLRAISLAFAGGVRVTDTFSLGFGATMGLRAGANAFAFVADAGALQNLQLNLDAKAKISLVPHAGISWNPGKAWHLTATVHAPQKLDVRARFQFLLATGVEQGSGLGFTFDFMPWQAAAGLGYDFYRSSDLTLTATGSILYARWSKYIDRQSTRPYGDYEWNDTVTPAFGVRMQAKSFAFALDGQYKPSPVPTQTGRTNYVDNNRFGLTMAIDYGFKWRKTPLAIGAQLQGYRLISRNTFKDDKARSQGVIDEVPDDTVIDGEPLKGRDGLQTNNPGWPGFWTGGWVTSAGLYVSAGF